MNIIWLGYRTPKKNRFLDVSKNSCKIHCSDEFLQAPLGAHIIKLPALPEVFDLPNVIDLANRFIRSVEPSLQNFMVSRKFSIGFDRFHGFYKQIMKSGNQIFHNIQRAAEQKDNGIFHLLWMTT